MDLLVIIGVVGIGLIIGFIFGCWFTLKKLAEGKVMLNGKPIKIKNTSKSTIQNTGKK